MTTSPPANQREVVRPATEIRHGGAETREVLTESGGCRSCSGPVAVDAALDEDQAVVEVARRGGVRVLRRPAVAAPDGPGRAKADPVKPATARTSPDSPPSGGLFRGDVPVDRVAAHIGGAIVIDAAVGARVIGGALRRARAEAARNGLAFDPTLAALLYVVERAEQAAVPHPAPAPVPGPHPACSAAADSDTGTVDTRAAAALASVSERAIRKAAAAGRLAGRQRGGRWEFTHTAVDNWIRSRRGAATP